MGGSKLVDKAWYNDAHLLLNFDNIGSPWQVFYNQAPAKKELPLKAIPNVEHPSPHLGFWRRLSNWFQTKTNYKLLSTVKMHTFPSTAKVRVLLWQWCMGFRNFWLRLVRINMLRKLNLRSSKAGKLSTQSQEIELTLQIRGPKKQVQEAERLLQIYMMNSYINHSGKQLQVFGEKAKHHSSETQNNKAHTALIETLANIPIGLQDDDTIVNVGIIESLPGGGIVAKFDVRAIKAESINAVVTQIQKQVETIQKKMPGVKISLEIPWGSAII